MTDEELACFLEGVALDVESFYADDQPEQIRQAATRLRELSRDGERYRAAIQRALDQQPYMATRVCEICSDLRAAIDQAMEKKG